MVLSSIYNQIRGNRLIGLSVIMKDNGIVVYGGEFLKSKNECKLLNSFEITSIDKVKDFVSGKFPVVLNFVGDGILNKKINGEIITDQNVEINIFPGLKLKDFWIQKHLDSKNEGYISICRLEVIKNIVNQLKKEHLFVTHVYLGVFNIERFLPYIQFKGGQMSLAGVSVDIENAKVKDVKRNSETTFPVYKFQDESVSGSILPIYCSVVHSIGDKKKKPESIIDSGVEESKFYKRYISVVFAFPVLLLLLLLINFIVFSYYSSVFNEESYLYSKNKVVLENLSAIEDELSKKEKFISNHPIINLKADLRYCDLLAKSLPADIYLSCLEINPVLGKIKKGKQISLQNNIILISGEVKHEVVLREWLEFLSELNWVEKLNINKYVHLDKKPIEFEILIKYKK